MSPPRRIAVLPEEAIAKIAAGEVVERPAAALKELVENAVDAGARRVEIAIAQGGVARIDVTDDGEGMAPDVLPLALMRHATSKIRTAEDLFAVDTFGFRGEALGAIAAAAGRLTLASCPAGCSGAEVVVQDGRAGPVLPAAQAPGTHVAVEGLFARIPARRAFLRSVPAEAAACHDVVLRAALASPAVAFRLRSERGEVFASSGNGDRADVLARAYGAATRAALMPVAYAEAGIRVEGYVADPAVHRATRAGETFLVRARPVVGRSLTYAAESAYAGRLARGRFPVFVLAVDLDPHGLDVNVHPQKREVRFADERRVGTAVHVAVQRALAGRSGSVFALAAGVPRADPEFDTDKAGQGQGEWAVGRLYGPSGRAAEPSRPWGGVAPAAVPPASPAASPPRPDPAAQPAPSDDTGRAGEPDPLWRGLVPLRQLRLLYILAEGPDGLYLVDQHAAHERVRYEAIEREERIGRGPSRQRLLPPLVLDLPASLAEVCIDRAAEVAAAGFAAAAFGPSSVRVTEVPSGIALPGQVLRDLLAGLADPTDTAPSGHRRRALMACRTAVRAGDALAPAEMARILADLGLCVAPATCPHGRPTVHRLGWDEVGAWFRRRA